MCYRYTYWIPSGYGGWSYMQIRKYTYHKCCTQNGKKLFADFWQCARAIHDQLSNGNIVDRRRRIPVWFTIRIAMIHMLWIAAGMTKLFQTSIALKIVVTIIKPYGSREYPTWNGFSPLCKRLCSVRWCLCLNALSHTSHLYGRWPANIYE